MVTKQSGTILLVTLVLILISTSFILLIYQQKQQFNLPSATTYMDVSIAEDIARLGIAIGLNEWKSDPNVKTHFTPNQQVLTNYSVLGGSLDLYFNDANNDFNINPITIKSVGKYNGITKTIEIDISYTSQKTVALIAAVGAITPDIVARKAWLQSIGWAVTVYIESSVGVPTLEQYNLVYIPTLVQVFQGNPIYSDARVPIAMEASTGTYSLGYYFKLFSSTSNSQITTVNLTTALTYPGCYFCYPSGAYSQTIQFYNSSNTASSLFISNDTIATDAYREYAHPFNPSTLIAMLFLEPGKNRIDNTASPHVRLALPMIINDINDWNSITTTGLNTIAQYLDTAGCNYGPPYCFKITTSEWRQLN